MLAILTVPFKVCDAAPTVLIFSWIHSDDWNVVLVSIIVNVNDLRLAVCNFCQEADIASDSPEQD